MESTGQVVTTPTPSHARKCSSAALSLAVLTWTQQCTTKKILDKSGRCLHGTTCSRPQRAETGSSRGKETLRENPFIKYGRGRLQPRVHWHIQTPSPSAYCALAGGECNGIQCNRGVRRCSARGVPKSTHSTVLVSGANVWMKMSSYQILGSFEGETELKSLTCRAIFVRGTFIVFRNLFFSSKKLGDHLPRCVSKHLGSIPAANTLFEAPVRKKCPR